MNFLVQGNEKFERMLTIGKESGNRRGLGYNSNDSTSLQPTYANVVKNGFVERKEKTKVISNKPMPHRRFTNAEKGKAI